MSNLQKNLETIKSTINCLADEINQASINNGGDTLITDCTSFTEYPDLLRSVVRTTSSSVITIFAYKISDTKPSVPDASEGLFDFQTNEYIVPESGCKASELNATETDVVGMIQAMFATNSGAENKIVDTWSQPICLSSINKTSAIISQKQQVYLSTQTQNVPNTPVGGIGNEALSQEYINVGGNEYPAGLSLDHPYIGTSIREFKNDQGSTYSLPVLYAYYAKDGQDGTSGLSGRTMFIFKSTDSRSNIPDKPIGGYGDIDNNQITIPDGWFTDPNPDETNKYTWMCTAEFTVENVDNPDGSVPICITGEDGIDGTDGVNSEFIYARVPSVDDGYLFKQYLIDKGYVLEISQTDTVPNFTLNGVNKGTSLTLSRTDNSQFTVTLTDSPLGIDELNYKVEMYWTRTKTLDSWGNGIGPMYWSVGGENGMDGDGIEYIFSVSNDATCDNLPPTYQSLLDAGNTEEAEKFQKPEYVPDGWFDTEPEGGVSPTYPYLFCCTRKQYKTEDGKQMWGDFSTPKIGGHGGVNGTGSYTAFAFCITKKDLSRYVVTGGSYENALANLITLDENNNDVSDEIQWTDSPNSIPAFDETIGMINKFFGDIAGEELNKGYGPVKIADSEHFQVEFNCPDPNDPTSIYDPTKTLISLEEFKNIKASESPSITFKTSQELETAGEKYVYDNGYGTGTDNGSGAVYMATARFVNNVGEEGSVNKIKGETGNSTQFIFTLTDGKNPADPNPESLDSDFQNDNYKPLNWHFEPQSVSEDEPICGVSQRTKYVDVGKKYSTPSIGSMYAKGNVHLELSEDNINVPCEPNGTIDVDYQKHVSVTLSLYDNGSLVNDASYRVLINNDTSDYIITNNPPLESIPTSPDVSGFYGNTLYLGSKFLDDRYQNDSKLRVECQAIHNNVPYTKTFVINKTTNAYSIKLSQQVLHLTSDGKFKTPYLSIQVLKGVDDKFQSVVGGYLQGIITFNDNTARIESAEFEADGIHDIYLYDLENVQSIEVQYKAASDTDILDSEMIGTVIDGRDGVDAETYFTSFVFARSPLPIGTSQYRPKSENKLDHVPIDPNGEITWSSTVPFGNDTVGMSQALISEANEQLPIGSIPSPMSDSTDIDIDGSIYSVENDPGTPESNPSAGTDANQDLANGMAIRTKSQGVWGSGTVHKIAGEEGRPGISTVTSVVFYRNNGQLPDPPTGGSFELPQPDGELGSDTIPSAVYDDKGNITNPVLWMSNRIFYSDSSIQNDGSQPSLMKDSETLDIWWSNYDGITIGNPDDPDYSDKGSDDEVDNPIGMAIRTRRSSSQTEWSKWVITRIKGEKGDDGIDAVSKFKSQVFCRTNANLANEQYRPKGGSFTNPIPDANYTVPDMENSTDDPNDAPQQAGSESIPTYNSQSPKQIGMSSRWFYSDGTEEDGSIPVLIQDTDTMDVGWCDDESFAPGTPDAPGNKSNSTGLVEGYDGDTVDGNNDTKSPIGMAVRRKSEGSGSAGTVSRIKGEKGEKGDPGKDGVDGSNGGFGALMRYGAGKNGMSYLDGKDGDEFYDVVLYTDSNRYLCIKDHTSSNSNAPGNTEYWRMANEFEFIASDLVLANNVVTDKLQVNKLITANDDTRITIMDGLIQVYGTNTSSPSIKFGLDEDGNAILQFLKNNKVLYDLGPLGLRDGTKSETYEKLIAQQFNYLSSAASTESMTKVIGSLKNTIASVSTTPTVVYELNKYSIIDGIYQADADHGKIYTDANKSALFSGYVLGSAEQLNKGTAYDPDYLSENDIKAIQLFANTYTGTVDTSGYSTIYARNLYHYLNGKKEETVILYYNK